MIIVLPSRVAKDNHISSRVSRLPSKTYFFENTALVNVLVQILQIHTHTSNFIWLWSSVEKNEIIYRHTAVELYTSHFKKYVFWKRQEGDHWTNFLESQNILKFTDTVTSLQDHSSSRVIVVCRISSGFCLKTLLVFFLGQGEGAALLAQLKTKCLQMEKTNFESLSIQFTHKST